MNAKALEGFSPWEQGAQPVPKRCQAHSNPATGESGQKRDCVIPREEELCPQPALSVPESQGCQMLLLQISFYGDCGEAGSS